MNAFLSPQGSLSAVGSLSVIPSCVFGHQFKIILLARYASSKMKRRSLHSHHLLGRNETQTDTETDDDAVHCDDTCELRNKQIEDYFAQFPPTAA
jgi:hypothetical protein